MARARSRVNIVGESTAYRDGVGFAEPGWRVTLGMDLDRFFLPEKFQLPGAETETGWQLEVSHRPGLPLLPRRLWFQGQPVRIED